MKRILISVLILLLLCTLPLVSCGEDTPPENGGGDEGGAVTPNIITLSKLSLSMYTGDEYTLEYTVLPEDASRETIEWSSTTPEVATVEGGVIRAHSVGTATVIAKSPTSKPSVCNVTVKEKPLTEAELLRLVDIDLPAFPILVGYTDPETGNRAIAQIGGAVVRMREERRTDNGEDVVRVFVKLNVTKVYDSEGMQGVSPIRFNVLVNAGENTQKNTLFKNNLKVGDKVALQNPAAASSVTLSSSEMGVAFDVREYREGRSLSLEIAGESDGDILTSVPLMPDSPEYEAELKKQVSISLPELPIRINYTDPESQKSTICEIGGTTVRIREVELSDGTTVARVFVKFSVTKLLDGDGLDGLNPIYFGARLIPDTGTPVEYEFTKGGDDALRVGERAPLINPDNVFDVTLSDGEIGFAFDARDYLSGRSFTLEVFGATEDDIVIGTPDTEEPDTPDEPTEPDIPDEPTEPDEPTVSGIKLSHSTLYIEPGVSFALTATLTDSLGNTVLDDGVIWESSDESILTCHGGVITARSEGMAMVTAKHGANVDACMVTVLEAERMVVVETPQLPLDLIYVDPETGKTVGFTVKVYTARHELDYRDGQGNFVRVTMRFEIEKTYDELGDDAHSPILFCMQILELGEVKQTVTFGDEMQDSGESRVDTSAAVGETVTVEYIFGSRFHEGKRTYEIRLIPLAAE